MQNPRREIRKLPITAGRSFSTVGSSQIIGRITLFRPYTEQLADLTVNKPIQDIVVSICLNNKKEINKDNHVFKENHWETIFLSLD